MSFVWHYDRDTLRFTESTPADYDQLDPGSVVVPAFATLTPVPSILEANRAAYWNPARERWEVRAEQPEVAPPSDTPALDETQSREVQTARLGWHLAEAERILRTLKETAAEEGAE